MPERHLGFIEIGRHINVAHRDEVQQRGLVDKLIEEDDVILHAQLMYARRQAPAIGLALGSYKVWMGRPENDIHGARGGFDDFWHGIEHGLDAFVGRQKTEREDDLLPVEAEFRLGVTRPDERKVGYPVRYDLDPASWHVVNGAKQSLAFLRHDDYRRRSVDDPMHDVALDGRWFREHGVKCSHDRHLETGQELDNVAPGFTAENPVLVLEGSDIESSSVEDRGCLDIVADHFVANLEAHSRRIVVGATRIRHGDDAGLKIRARWCDRPVQIMGKGSDAAATRKMIADERHTLKPLHFDISKLLFVEAALFE